MVPYGIIGQMGESLHPGLVKLVGVNNIIRTQFPEDIFELDRRVLAVKEEVLGRFERKERHQLNQKYFFPGNLFLGALDVFQLPASGSGLLVDDIEFLLGEAEAVNSQIDVETVVRPDLPLIDEADMSLEDETISNLNALTNFSASMYRDESRVSNTLGYRGYMMILAPARTLVRVELAATWIWGDTRQLQEKFQEILAVPHPWRDKMTWYKTQVDKYTQVGIIT